MPPVKGIIRARDNNGVDLADDSPLEVWQERLSVIFREMLVSKSSYLQIRYIAVEGNGLELERVDRQTG